MLRVKLTKLNGGARPAASRGERGAALTMAMIIIALIGIVSVATLAVVSNEVRVAGSDLERTKTFYAAASGLEKMTSDFSSLYVKTAHPTATQLANIANSPPAELVAEGFQFRQTLALDQAKLDALRADRGGRSPVSTVPHGPFAGLIASLEPYHLTSLTTHYATKTQVRLERDVNNYLIPLFQFGTFSDKDLEFWPEPPMTFNGRVHANGNIYFGGDITFLDKVTTAHEAVRGVLRNNAANTTLVGGSYTSNPRFIEPSSGITVQMTQGSVTNGPYLTPQPRADGRGNFQGSPAGTDNTAWKTNSVAAVAANTPNRFGGQLLTRSTGARQLLLPLQLDGRQPFEIIKRSMPDDNTTLNLSRYHTKAAVRILIDDEAAGSGTSNVAGIPAGQGVLLSQFVPTELDGGNALRMVDDNGNYLAAAEDWFQGDTTVAGNKKKARVVRGVRNDYAASVVATQADAATGGFNAKTNGTAPTEYTQNLNNPNIPKTTNGAIVPPGSGIRGRILIEVVNADGTARDVTQAVLSMGVTVGEPNAIVHLQRPLWAAFMQGSRDRAVVAGNDHLTYFMDNSRSDRRALADGEINTAVGLTMSAFGSINSADNNFDDDPHAALTPFKPTAATMERTDKPPTGGLNQIVPINVYNVREGRINEFTLASTNVYSRGITSVVEINMRNLARWVDGVYDNNLLNGTNAVSANIGNQDGWIVYVSDRRGDRVKSERDSNGSTILTTNGLVDNEDIYNYPSSGQTPDPGEDVIDEGFDIALARDKKGSLQRDTLELPDPAAIASTAVAPPAGYADSTRYGRALAVGTWGTSSQNAAGTPGYHFRRAVRLFNGEDQQVTGATGRLSLTKGLTVATENMVYIWGNYNTTGITCQPTSGSTLNDPLQNCNYTGDQVPASIVSDAFFPLSKTWFDSLSAMYPEGGNARIADAGIGGAPVGSSNIPFGDETAVRAGIIAGTTLSAMVGAGAPSYFLQWLNGGVHNFPRFLETWSVAGSGWEKRWNYVGSFIILYNSKQAVGPWGVISNVNYAPPRRNWAFDISFTDPNRLPPGTPLFQFVQATGFRETLP